jgi:hypothetical protein
LKSFIQNFRGRILSPSSCDETPTGIRDQHCVTLQAPRTTPPNPRERRTTQSAAQHVGKYSGIALPDFVSALSVPDQFEQSGVGSRYISWARAENLGSFSQKYRKASVCSSAVANSTAATRRNFSFARPGPLTISQSFALYHPYQLATALRPCILPESAIRHTQVRIHDRRSATAILAHNLYGIVQRVFGTLGFDLAVHHLFHFHGVLHLQIPLCLESDPYHAHRFSSSKITRTIPDS